ncbi:chorismate synthase [Parvularcula sp. LCG005]|nr:chorismate synthase [Parvularcula sp. LCG005]WOI52634.1 chorismate synthase [Parvularcula sp. LCG005]
MNSFGSLFRVTTWGESHGPAIGCVIDGCPAGIRLTEAMIQRRLDERRPGTSRFVTQRQEPDQVRILSGVFEDDRTDGPITTGTPISLMIENVDQRSKDYSDIRDKFRPGHADYTYDAKYGVRDYRGGGRSSARETAMRVAAGAVAEEILKSLYGGSITIDAGLTGMGPHTIDEAEADWSTVADNPFWCPVPADAAKWEAILDAARKDGSSLGALVTVIARGVPAGLGAPIYNKLDSDLAMAMMTINAAKGFEIGAGRAAATLSGIQNADEMRMGPDGQPVFTSNNNGGVLGGISSGQDIVVRVAIKPTSSILTPRKTVDRAGKETEIVTKGRHDPCVGIRGVPVARAMMACVLADHALLHRGQTGRLGPI